MMVSSVFFSIRIYKIIYAKTHQHARARRIKKACVFYRAHSSLSLSVSIPTYFQPQNDINNFIRRLSRADEWLLLKLELRCENNANLRNINLKQQYTIYAPYARYQKALARKYDCVVHKIVLATRSYIRYIPSPMYCDVNNTGSCFALGNICFHCCSQQPNRAQHRVTVQRDINARTLDFGLCSITLLALGGAFFIIHFIYTNTKFGQRIFFFCVWDIEVYSHDYGFVFLCAVSVCVLFIHTHESCRRSRMYIAFSTFFEHTNAHHHQHQADWVRALRAAGVCEQRRDERSQAVQTELACSQPTTFRSIHCYQFAENHVFLLARKCIYENIFSTTNLKCNLQNIKKTLYHFSPTGFVIPTHKHKQ